MRNHVVLLVTVLLTLPLFSCNRTYVTLDYTNARDEVPQLGNLIFRFSKALVSDSLLNRWDSSNYVYFEPSIHGSFRWEHPDELVFSPSRPLPPATSFKAIINRDILQYSKYARIKNTDKVVFHTPALKLENTNNTWVLQDEQSKIAVPQVELSFNYPVNPAALKNKMHIEVDGKKTDYNLQTLSADNKISVRLLNIKVEDKDYNTRISIGKGLVPEGGGNGTDEITEINSVISSPYLLNINDVFAEYSGILGTVSVKTSQAPEVANLASYITLKPAVKFSVELTDEGFLISSESFNSSRSYELTIAKGLRGKIGGVLNENYNNNLAFGELEPGISFTSNKSVYLSSMGSRNIEVSIVNVPRVKLIVSKIYENNLLPAQRYGYYPKETSAGGDKRDYDEEDVNATFGDVIYEKELDTRSLPKFGNHRLLNFNISDQLRDFKGIYHISVRSLKDYWVNDSRFISLSDIGLIAREGREKIYVYANSIKTTSALSGVKVLVYGNNNQLLGMADTNNEGAAEIAYSRKEFAGFRPAILIAKTADDFNYLPFASTKVETSRFDVGGRQSNPTGMDAFIYAERDIYRPGEKVNFSVIVRNGSWQSPGDIPLKLKFLMPNGKELKTFRKTLNEQGAAEGSIDISTSAITGSYSLEVYSSNDILLSTKSFMIEEFVPDRIRITASLAKLSLQPGESTTLQINAMNFFGPPASNRNYESEIQLKQKALNPKNFDRYNFNLANQNSFFDKIVKEGKTDENGNATETYVVPRTYTNIGVLQSTFYTTVFDETGRPVSRNVSADIFTQQVFLGLGKDEYGYYPLNQVIKFPLVAIDKNERLVKGTTAEVKIIKHEYKTILAKNGSYFRYDSQKQDKLISGSTIRMNGENTLYSFVPRSPGEYEVRLSIPGANSYVSRSFYSYGGWGGENNSFQVNNEGNIDIETDKTTYLVGETAKVLFKTPFSGRMLVSMETDRVLFQEYVNVDKRSVSLDLKLSARYLPNVYITATLIKPHEVSDIPLTVAHGFHPVKVEEKNRKIGVQIVAEPIVRSHTHQKITVKATTGTYVTLAAVDDGVLQVSDFKTPDPYNYFYGKKALEVNGYDIYPSLKYRH